MPRRPRLPDLPERATPPPVKGPRSAYLRRVPLPTEPCARMLVLRPAGYGLIERLSAGGRNLASIAAALGVSHDTFSEIRKRDPEAVAALERGRAALGDELTDVLLDYARSGGKGGVIAAIFLAKARCGWREGEGIEGARTVNNTQINISIPERMSEQEFRSIIDGTFREQQQKETDDNGT